MKINSILLLSAIALIQSVFGQRETLDLAFTAIDSNSHRHLDSIKVLNRSRYGNTMLYWPDTVLSIYYVGVEENSQDNEKVKLFQNYPNPVSDQTTISMYIPAKNKVILVLTDLLGKQLLQSEMILDKGIHSFSFTGGGGNLYIFTVFWKDVRNSIKIVNLGPLDYNSISLKYLGRDNTTPSLKSRSTILDLNFCFGDELLFIGYSGNLESGFLDRPEISTTYTFQYATNIPCLGSPTVEYEGQVYNTIQIFSQCWLKENLNVGNMIPGAQDMTDNGMVEKYCYNNVTDSCTKYGGLYQWDEMMQYTLQLGTQGICPPGWHIPTDEEFKVLEGAVDSWFGIGDHEWDLLEWIGYDAGMQLKTIAGWYGNNSSTDAFGFSSLPGGFRLWYTPYSYEGTPFSYEGITLYSVYWTSTKVASTSNSYSRYQVYYSDQSFRYYFPKEAGHGVRCIRDD